MDYRPKTTDIVPFYEYSLIRFSIYEELSTTVDDFHRLFIGFWHPEKVSSTHSDAFFLVACFANISGNFFALANVAAFSRGNLFAPLAVLCPANLAVAAELKKQKNPCLRPATNLALRPFL